MKKLDILKELTIEEKVNWTSGNNMWYLIGSKRLEIKEILVADGPHGVRVYNERPGHNTLNLIDLAPSTLFPSARAMASTFNESLIFKVGETIGKECNMHDVDILLAPGLNLKRSPLGGRNFEYYSEDPYLTGRTAINFINGVQSTGVGTCIKHFALNEQENQRRFINSIVDERTMNELYLKPFEMAIKEANPWSVMTSYNKVNGHYSAESTELIKDTLRTKWNYKGAVMSDWGGVQDKVKSIKNGLNVEMPGPSEFIDDVYKALEDGTLTEQEIDESLLPLLDLTDKIALNNNKLKPTNLTENHLIARKVAEEAIVLLKNNGILPLKLTDIAVIGEFAATPRINGGGSATLKPFILENPLEELRKEFNVSYAKGYIEDDTNAQLLEEVKNAVQDKEVIIYFTGTTKNLEVEGKDREHMNLPKGHLEVFEVLRHLNKPIIVILNNGSAIDLTNVEEYTSAILESWFLGGANAVALVNVLKGIVNPSGRLSETFPLCIQNTPHYGVFPAKEGSVNYSGDIINSGYKYYDTHKYPVRYPFGYGLSYTTFTYSNLQVDKEVIKDSQLLNLTVDITNTGSLEGKEVVQIYVEDIESYYPHPKKELVAYKKLNLKPNETKTVKFSLDENAFNVYSMMHHDFKVEPGEFNIHVAKNVNEVVLSIKVTYTTKEPFITELSLAHPLKNFGLYKKEQAEKIINKYRAFPWYEIEEPTLRVLKRIKKEFKLTDIEFQDMLDELLK